MSTKKQAFYTAKGDLAAVVHTPAKETGLLAILCPGYLDSKDYGHLVGLAEVLCEHGYTVVRFDPTGTWESGGAISDYTNTQYLEDIKTIVDAMQGAGSYHHTLLGGHSRGGTISLLYAARDARITQIVAIMPSSGTLEGSERVEWKKDGIKVSTRDLPENRDQMREYRVPFSHVLDRDRHDVIKDVVNVHVPILFLAGERDDIIPPEEVKEIYDHANEPKTLILLKGMGHNYRFSAEEVRTVNELIIKELTKEVSG